jgi:hypothetical protein
MTSKAQAKRQHRASRAMPQRRGRALTEGASRYPCGKLKPLPNEPVLPNEATIRLRIQLAGTSDPRGIIAAENPLDLALFRGWISKKEHEAGEALIEVYRKAGLDLPDIRVQDLNRVAKGHSEGMGDASKMRQLRDIAEALHCWPKCRKAVFALVILREWPRWMIERITTGGNQGFNGVGRVHLMTGLKLIGKVLGVGVDSERMAAA